MRYYGTVYCCGRDTFVGVVSNVSFSFEVEAVILMVLVVSYINRFGNFISEYFEAGQRQEASGLPRCDM